MAGNWDFRKVESLNDPHLKLLMTTKKPSVNHPTFESSNCSLCFLSITCFFQKNQTDLTLVPQVYVTRKRKILGNAFRDSKYQQYWTLWNKAPRLNFSICTRFLNIWLFFSLLCQFLRNYWRTKIGGFLINPQILSNSSQEHSLLPLCFSLFRPIDQLWCK